MIQISHAFVKIINNLVAIVLNAGKKNYSKNN